MNRQKIKMNSGYAVILTTMLFFALAMAILFAIVGPVLASYSTTRALTSSKKSFLLANAVFEESMYRLKQGMTISNNETIELEQGEATAEINSTADGKSISVTSLVGDYVRNIDGEVSTGEGVSFSYGIQSGQGGFVMSGGAGIYGSVYSNGDIVGSGGPFITGSAIVANASEPIANQSNSGSSTPTYSISFGSNNPPQDLAQSFIVSTTTPISSVKFYLKRSSNNWMNNATVRIVNNSSGKPGKTTLASGTLNYSQVTTAYNYLSIPFTTPPTLTPGTTYWMVIDASTTWGESYIFAATNATYANGLAKTGTWSSSNGGTWSDTSPVGLDIYMDIYAGGDTGLISGIIIGTGGIGDAWAHEVNNSTVAGTIYCQSASGNNKACNTSRPDPAEQPYPLSDANIQSWKDEALEGGIQTGNLSYGGADVASLGPKKIVGNLSVGAGARLNITGPLWVTGNITLSGGAIIKLDSSYSSDSGVIVSDGRISAGGGGQFQGSGTSGSYILVITTSGCPDIGSCSGNPAISISGGTGSVILNAQSGTIEASGGAQAKQMTAKKIIMSGGTTIRYESGLIDINFSDGPTGGWNVKRWQEVE
jgi:hypothetical protein